MANEKPSERKSYTSNLPSCSTVVLYLCMAGIFVRVELLSYRLRHEGNMITVGDGKTIPEGNVEAKYSDDVVSRPKRSLSADNQNFSELFEKEFAKQMKLLTSDYLCSPSRHKFCIMRGPPGPRGPRGRKGRRGMSGKRGSQGILGPPGRQGKTGMRGTHGLPGKNGRRGNPGPPGPVGPRGPRGERGESISSPTVVASPLLLTVNQSSRATFFCGAQGNPKPEVIWTRVSGSLAPHNTRVDSKGKLTITAADYSDSGTYQCTAKNILGSAEIEVDLSVQVPVRITRSPSQRIVEEGKDAVLTCEAWGSPPPTISWSRTPGNLPFGRFILTREKFIISNTTLSDSGTYICSARNVLNRETASAFLMVVPQLKFTKKPQDTTEALLGETVTLHCQARSGSMKPTISWTKAQGQLPRGHQVLKNGSLIMKISSVSDSGTYLCTARNTLSTITANTSIVVRYSRTCSELRRAGFTTSQTYAIDPDGTGGESTFSVYCDMTDRGGVGVTMISHDSEARTLVKGYSSKGSYSRDVRYSGVSKAQLASLMGVSQKCEQFIKYECYHSVLLYHGSPYGWWVSRNGQKMTYWGGATPGSGNCACGVTNLCATSGNKCNCDSNDYTWREDSGLLTDKTTLPVSQLRFGDTSNSEKGYHTLGKLKCYGTA